MVSLVYTELAAGSVTAQRSLAWALIPFMSGLALAAVLAGRNPRWRDRRRARAVALAVFLSGLAIALVAGRVGPSTPWFTNLLATLSVTGLLWAPVMLEVGGGGTWRWLDNPVLAWIGARSYAIYLWHVALMSELYPLVDGIEGYRVAFLALFPLVLVASAAVAEVSWRLVEQPALRLRAHRRPPVESASPSTPAGRRARRPHATASRYLARRRHRRFHPAMTVIHEPHRFDGPAALLAYDTWQMTFGERAALEGLLVRLRPELAIEIGTAEGGSTRCLPVTARRSTPFDLAHPEGLTDELPQVVTHPGDSHVLLPAFLERLAAAGRTVDFALVDGDHTAEGVRRDVEDLLASPAVRRTVIVAHDAGNEDVRAGLLATGFQDHPAVAFADLDFVTGHLSATGPFPGQLWGGLALIVVDEDATAAHRSSEPPEFHANGDLLRAGQGSPREPDMRNARRSGRFELG